MSLYLPGPGSKQLMAAHAEAHFGRGDGGAARPLSHLEADEEA